MIIIVPIFVDENDASEGLHAVHLDMFEKNEFDRTFDLWSDAQYLLQYAKTYQHMILNGYYNVTSLEDFIEQVMDEALDLEKMILDFIEDGFETTGNKLQEIFKPLDNNQSSVPDLQTTKARLRTNVVRQPKLRLFALRFDANSFVMTGGVIKVTHRLDDCPATKSERLKLSQIRDDLYSRQIYGQAELNEYYHEQY